MLLTWQTPKMHTKSVNSTSYYCTKQQYIGETQGKENINYLTVPVWLFLKCRPDQLSCPLFGFLFILTLTYRVFLAVDNSFAEKSVLCLNEKKQLRSLCCQFRLQTLQELRFNSHRVVRGATFPHLCEWMVAACFLTVVVDKSYEICLCKTVVFRVQIQASCLVTVVNKSFVTITKASKLNHALPLDVTHQISDIFMSIAFSWPGARL